MGNAGKSGGDIGYQLHLQKKNRILDLQFSLLETPQLQFIEPGLLPDRVDHGVEAAMLELQFGDAVLDRLGISHGSRSAGGGFAQRGRTHG